MKKILIMIESYFNAGTERHAVNLANRFAEKGYHVDILVVGGVAEQSVFSLRENVSIIAPNAEKRSRQTGGMSQNISVANGAAGNETAGTVEKDKALPAPKKSMADRFRSLYHVRKLRFFKFYHPIFKRSRPDIIIVFHQKLLIRAYYGTLGMRCKIFVNETFYHGAALPREKAERARRLRLLRKAEMLIVQTKQEKEFYDRYADKVIVINNPIVDNLPAPYTGTREKTIVNFCRINPQKNLKLLISAFQMLHRDYPDYKLTVYGGAVSEREHEYYQQLMRIISDAGLEDHVSILPSRQDIHNAVLKSGMFVSSSDYEGLSNSMLEAMAIGLPCVCTDCDGGGTREVMTDHENGLIVPKNEVDAMYRAMKEFIYDPVLARKCSENAVKIREMLNGKVIAQKWLEVIKTVEV